MIGSPQQLAEVLFDKLGLSRKRRGKTGFSTDARVLQAIRDEHPIVPKIERWRELTEARPDLPRRAAAADRRRRAAAHDASARRPPRPAGCASTNPNLQNIPIRTELGREIRACFVAEPGNVLISRRLLAGRAARARPHRGRGGAAEIFARGEDVHTATAAAVFGTPPDQLDRRDALEGEDGQLRDRLRALRLRPRRPPADPAGGGAGVHRPLPRALPGGRAVHGRRGRRRPRSTATSRRCSAAAARSPSCARATGRRASSASGSPSTRSSRAPRPTSSRSRWCAATTRSRDAGLATRHDPADPRRAAVRGARGGGRARRGDRRRRRWSARPTSTRRWPSTPASGPTGWRRSDALMDRGVAIVLATAFGGGLALQAPFNSMLAQRRRPPGGGRRVRRRAHALAAADGTGGFGGIATPATRPGGRWSAAGSSAPATSRRSSGRCARSASAA